MNTSRSHLYRTRQDMGKESGIAERAVYFRNCIIPAFIFQFTVLSWLRLFQMIYNRSKEIQIL